MVFTDTLLTDLKITENLSSEQTYFFNQKFFQKKVALSKTAFPTQLKFKPFIWESNWYMEFVPSKPVHLSFYNKIEDFQYFFVETLQYLINDYFIPSNLNLNGHIWGLEGIFNEPFEIYIKDNILIGTY